MIVIHAHWQPPRNAEQSGGFLFWAETSETAPPAIKKAREGVAQYSHIHPYCLHSNALRERIGNGTPLYDAPTERVVLHMPSTRAAPLPSPDLVHKWRLDSKVWRFADWEVYGLWLPAGKAFSVLISLPEDRNKTGFTLGRDTIFWKTCANLMLEVLSTQKYIPRVIISTERDHFGYARWQPVMDSPSDSYRLRRLAEGMPGVCRAEAAQNGYGRNKDYPTASYLLQSYFNSMCDSIVRSWGKSSIGYEYVSKEPAMQWLAALIREDARIDISTAQAQALHSSLKAWLRYLHMAGDSNFRIAFRLEAPSIQDNFPGEQSWKLHYMLQSRQDPSLIISADDLWNNPAGVAAAFGFSLQHPQEKLLAGLGYAGRFFSPILTSLQSRCPSYLNLDLGAAYRFLREAAGFLEQAGFGLIAPPWWNQKSSRLGLRLRLSPRATRAAQQTGAPSRLGMSQLVHYEWELSLGETRLTRQEFEALVALKAPLVQIRGQWVHLDSSQVEAAIRFWEKENQNGDIDLMRAASLSLGGQDEYKGLPINEVTAEGWVEEWLQQMGSSEKLAILPQPQGFTGELRPYQLFGYSWLDFFRRFGLGACLADDMGLGKTIQALALFLREKEIRGEFSAPILLVCPTSVVINWDKEAKRFAPSIRTLIHQGSTRLRGEALIESLKNVDVVFTSYAILRQDAEVMLKQKWLGLVIDEAQNIKNPDTRQAQLVRKFNPEFRIALTGTPVENRLSDLWSIMNFLNPGYLGPMQSFQRNFAIPIERFRNQETAERLQKLISPFILRRLKTDKKIIQDLPEKIESKVFCSLTEEQATLYQAVVQKTLQEITEKSGIERRGNVLAMIMKLKQICNHPAQFLHENEAGNAILNGRSGKVSRLAELLDEILAVDDRVIIFTQFSEMGRLLEDHFEKHLGYTSLFMHGGTPPKKREEMVLSFQEDVSGPPIFIISLKAGGIGLNLTRATHVIHFDRWWNPAVEDQATDRTYRIGQTRNIQVHKFVTAGTLEEKIDEMIESKKNLADSVISSAEEWITELSTDELRDIVSLRQV